MAKLISMDEAAQMLGLTIEELNELRSRSEIFGYRDGSSWKFKEDEIKRVASRMAADKSPEGSAYDMSSGIDDDLDQLIDVGDMSDYAHAEQPEESDRARPGQAEDADDEFVLADDAEVGEASEEKPSTVIGANEELVVDDDLGLEAGDDELQLAPDDSEVLDLSDDSIQSDESEKAPVAKTEDTSVGMDDDEMVDSDELRLAPDDDFEVSTTETVEETESEEEDEEDFALSDAGLDLDGGSEVDLVLDEESDNLDEESVVLDEEAPTELASSGDDLMLGDDDMLLEEPEDTAQAKADDDFLLTPVDGESTVDESDSGSQVIELDEDFEASDEPLITEADEDEQGLEEAAEAAPMRASLEPKPEYSVWNVVGLLLVVLLYLPIALMMVDLMRNMWSWSGTNALNSRMMDAILSMFGA